MSSYWPTEEGWPYPDSGFEPADLDFELDEDRMALRERSSHLLDGLDPLERAVISGRFGLGGLPARSMKELHADLGLPRADLSHFLGSGLAKIRRQLTD